MHSPNHGCLMLLWVEDTTDLDGGGGLTELEGYLQYMPRIPGDLPNYTGELLMIGGSPCPIYTEDTMALVSRMEN